MVLDFGVLTHFSAAEESIGGATRLVRALLLIQGLIRRDGSKPSVLAADTGARRTARLHARICNAAATGRTRRVAGRSPHNGYCRPVEFGRRGPVARTCGADLRRPAESAVSVQQKAYLYGDYCTDTPLLKGRRPAGAPVATGPGNPTDMSEERAARGRRGLDSHGQHGSFDVSAQQRPICAAMP